MKKALLTLSAILSIILLTLCFTLPATAADTMQSGTWGTLSWELNETTGELIISGEGKMENFDASDSPSAWRNHRASIKSVTIEDGVTSIGAYAFSACPNLMSVSISNSVTSIERFAFAGNAGLTDLSIPNSVTRVGKNAFSDCSNLIQLDSYICYVDRWVIGCMVNTVKMVTLRENTVGIADYAFYGTDLMTVSLPEGLTIIGNTAFAACDKLAAITIPDTVTTIGSQAFMFCRALKSVSLGNELTNIGAQAFYYCNITSITIPNSVTNIGESAFEECANLTSVKISENLTSIGKKVFDTCSLLESITIPHSVKSIGEFAFANCSLKSVTIGKSVISIADNAFEGCSVIKDILYCGSDPNIGAYFSSTVSIQCHRYAWESVDPENHQQICSACGAVKLTESHTWNGGEFTISPTHRDTGIITYTCTACGETKTETAEKFAHSFGDWCSHDAAQHKRVCDCGEIEYASHVYSNDQDNSCDTCGEVRILTEKSSGCGASLSGGISVAMLFIGATAGFLLKRKKKQ